MNKNLMTAMCGLLLMGCSYFDEGELIDFADPTIVVANGKYYMTGTSSDEGFTMLESSDLKHWTPCGDSAFILHRGPDTYGDNCFWAPQVLPYEGKYLLTYSAQGKMCIAESDQVSGPYKQRERRPISDCPEMNIDTYLFQDDDGKWYLYHARYMQQGDMGGNTIQVAEFDMASQRIIDSTLTLCVQVSEPWELTFDGEKFGNKTCEGPTVIKRDGVYYLFYSGNDYQSIDYAVGYATAPTPYGPWTKQPGPIISRNETGENGSGHGDFFIGLDKKPYYVFHVHQNDTTIHPRTVRIVELKMTRHRTTGQFLISPRGKKEDIIVPRVYKQ